MQLKAMLFAAALAGAEEPTDEPVETNEPPPTAPPPAPPVVDRAPEEPRRPKHVAVTGSASYRRIYDVEILGGDAYVAYRTQRASGDALAFGLQGAYGQTLQGNPVIIVAPRAGIDLRVKPWLGIGVDGQVSYLAFVRATTGRPIGALGIGVTFGLVADVVRFENDNALFLGASVFGDMFELEGNLPPITYGVRSGLGYRWSIGGKR